MLKNTTKLPRICLLSGSLLLWSSVCYANMIWPALYVLDSYYRFWYVALGTVALEACVLRYCLPCPFKKAILMSCIANVFSATIGLYVLTFGMIGWHAVVDNIVNGTFHVTNEIATVLLMWLLSGLLEALLVRIIWKYPLKRTAVWFLIGNCVSYAAIAVDLFLFGGWSRVY
jgi:hypothetical protein